LRSEWSLASEAVAAATASDASDHSERKKAGSTPVLANTHPLHPRLLHSERTVAALCCACASTVLDAGSAS